MWWHRWVLWHKVVQVKIMPAVWVHGGQRPKRRLINCACGQAWVRR